jgi:ZIP family zinc transporter
VIGIVLAGATIIGATLLAGTTPEVIGFAQAIAAGALLAVVSISIIPHAFEDVDHWVALYSVLGFVVGYVLG